MGRVSSADQSSLSVTAGTVHAGGRRCRLRSTRCRQAGGWASTGSEAATRPSTQCNSSSEIFCSKSASAFPNCMVNSSRRYGSTLNRTICRSCFSLSGLSSFGDASSSSAARCSMNNAWPICCSAGIPCSASSSLHRTSAVAPKPRGLLPGRFSQRSSVSGCGCRSSHRNRRRNARSRRPIERSALSSSR